MRLSPPTSRSALALALMLIPPLAVTAFNAPSATAVNSPSGPPIVSAARTGDLVQPDAVTASTAARAMQLPVEDLSQRTEDTRVFANPDGSWTSEATPSPVRVQDADGGWADIDTSLGETSLGLVPEAAKNNLIISAGGDTTFASLEIEGRLLEWKWPRVLPEPTIDGNTATFADVVDDGDLVVTALPTGFEHHIVLRKRPDSPVAFEIPIVTHGPILSESVDGSLQIGTKAGDELVSAPVPVMYEESDQSSSKDTPVDVSISKSTTGSVLTLKPSEAFLSDPETTYPVIIDPVWSSTNPDDTWIGNAAPNDVHPYDETLKVGSPNSGTSKHRTLVTFNTAAVKPWGGQVVTSAFLKLRNFNSLTCSGAGVEVRRITSSWAPGTVTWNNPPTATSTGAGLASGAYGFGTGCAADDMVWNVTTIAQAWADGASYYGFLIRAVDETKNAGYREFRAAGYSNDTVVPRLTVTYNRYPKTPGTPVVNPSEAGLTTSLTPTLSATVKDPDGGTVKGKFAVTRASDGSAVWSGTSAAVASGSAAWVTVPSGALSNGIKYDVRVTANDGSLNSIASSVATSFTAQLPASSIDPVIQQILNLSNPGTTEGKVVEIVNSIVAGSSEDGVTTPLTFDQAKQELLNFMLDTSQAGPETPTSTPAASTCEWSIQAAGSDVVAGHLGEAVPLTLVVATPDPHAPVYAGVVGGEQVHVTLYKGTSPSEAASLLATSEANMDALAAASLSGAVDGEQESEVSQHFENLPAPAALAAVAYRVDVGDAVEYGLPESGLTNGQLAMAATDTSRVCVRTGTDVGAELSTEAGKIIFSNPAEVLAQASDTYPDTSSAVRYRTFIPGATANTSWVCGKFKGDDRTYGSYYDLGNRTRASVFFNWPDQTIDTTKHVGTTHRLAGYGRSAKAKTASSAGINIHDASIAPTFGRIVITHSVGNPLCSFAGNITYNVVVEAWKNDGVARVSGTRVKVPAHEAYYYPKTEAYGRTILKKPAKYFICLTINCGQETLWETSS